MYLSCAGFIPMVGFLQEGFRGAKSRAVWGCPHGDRGVKVLILLVNVKINSCEQVNPMPHKARSGRWCFDM